MWVQVKEALAVDMNADSTIDKTDIDSNGSSRKISNGNKNIKRSSYSI